LDVSVADLVEFLDERPVKELVERFVETGCESFGVEVVALAISTYDDDLSSGRVE